jgi:hypothetical protein
MWTIRATNGEFEQLGNLQKINFIPNIKELCRKDRLHVNVRSFQARYAGHFDFWPVGFLLERPSELEAFMAIYQLHDRNASLQQSEQRNAEVEQEQEQQQYEQGGGGADDEEEEAPVYIIKKPMQACGRGVYLVNSLDKVTNMLSPGSPCYPLEKHKPLAQRYSWLASKCILPFQYQSAHLN